MDSQERVIKYMRKKAELLSELLDIPEDFYFTEQDEEALRSMKADRDKVWSELPQYFYCPFCRILRGQCVRCPYLLRHGKCGEEGSTFDTIVGMTNRLNLDFIDLVREIYKEEVQSDQ